MASVPEGSRVGPADRRLRARGVHRDPADRFARGVSVGDRCRADRSAGRGAREESQSPGGHGRHLSGGGRRRSYDRAAFQLESHRLSRRGNH